MATNAVFNRDGWGQENTETQADDAAKAPESPVDSTPEPTEKPQDRPVATPTEDDGADPRSTDAESNGREDSGGTEPERPADRGDHQPSSTPADPTPAHGAETVDDPEPSSEPAEIPEDSDEKTDSPKAMTLESAVDDETVGQRIGRWDAARLNLPRPPADDAGATRSDNQVDNADQRTVDQANAVAYITAMKDQRPWLAPAADCEPAVQSIYASLDQGTGHAHIRHGPMGDDKMYANRVARLEDPAQLDVHQRARGVDGFHPPNLHHCAELATRVHDVRAFAAMVAGLSEEPKVQQALHTDWEDVPPTPVSVLIADVLGPNGHEYCSGFRLKGEWPQSKADRREWVQAHAAGQDLGNLAEPHAERIPTFEGGRFVVMFKRNHSARLYEISTIVAVPVEE